MPRLGRETGLSLSGPGLKALQEDLHAAVTYEKRGALYIMEDLLSKSYTTMHTQMTVTKSVPLETLQAAHAATESKALEEWLCWPGMRISAKAGQGGKMGCMEKELADVGLAAADLHKAMREAARDKRITQGEERVIRGRIREAMKELLDVETMLDTAMAQGGRIEVGE